ncbi:CrcB protein [Microlunatus sagamiharensis]|uniref:Fluoride-specific ion channel FluC n=1 Tax=Microlunatus sagamiharensis TaxID=546874 RepID=A0A1H2M4F6_9ACTN|nr:CrcB family protein [Microlunatus sagamiharensis]SDU87994.1 CrcB protein [Microlunatus sagamiharensis]
MNETPELDPAKKTVDDPFPELPLDPDAEAAETTTETGASGARPVHLTPSNIALVATGGAVGTGLRLLLEDLVPRWGGVPVVTLAINVVGAFLLGLLLEKVADPALDERWSRRARLGLGTGGLGGFTTYSALATDTALLGHERLGLAAAYAGVTVVVGLLASIGGITLARRARRTAVDDGQAAAA